MFEETLRCVCRVLFFSDDAERMTTDSRNFANTQEGEREREREKGRAALDFFVGYPVRQLFFLCSLSINIGNNKGKRISKMVVICHVILGIGDPQ